MTDVEQKKDKDSKKIFTMLILVVTLAFCTTSATYAYFAIGATNNNTVTGTAATGSLIMTNATTSSDAHSPELIAPSEANKNLPMVPQISYTGTTNVLQKAFNGATGKGKCVDGNGNVICKAYTFVVKNLGTSVVAVRGSIKFTYTSGNFNHLRWKLMSDATHVTVSSSTASATFSDTAPIVASASKIYFDRDKVSLAANGGNKQYWLIVWIEESGADQSHIEKPSGASESPSIDTEDYGTWTATIAFEAVDKDGTAIDGVTSTITG